MKTKIQYNLLNDLWVLSVNCKYEECPDYIKIFNKILGNMLLGSVIPNKNKRILSGKHYLINNEVVELHTDEWFPLLLASKSKQLLDGINAIFTDMINVSSS
jgi:hypothetical protein